MMATQTIVDECEPIEFGVVHTPEELKWLCEILQERIEFFGQDEAFTNERRVLLDHLDQLGGAILYEEEDIIKNPPYQVDRGVDASTILLFCKIDQNFEYLDRIPSHYRKFIGEWMHIDFSDYKKYKAWVMFDVTGDVYGFSHKGIQVVLASPAQINNGWIAEVYPDLYEIALETLQLVNYFEDDIQ